MISAIERPSPHPHKLICLCIPISFVIVTGNFPTITRVLLAKIPPTDGQMMYMYDDHVFHYMVDSGICFLCMSDEKKKHRLPYAFLQELKQSFVSTHRMEDAQRAIAFSFNEEFSPTIGQLMEKYNHPNVVVDNIDALKVQIDDVKEGMIQNIENLLERGEKIELLVDKTERLNQQSFKFESSSRSLRRHMYWRSVRRKIIGGAIGAAIVLWIVSSACGGMDFHRCRL